MNIVIVPDTHGRDFWKKACNTEADKIIFLGDYLDHYPDESTHYHDIANFLEILDFKKKFPEKVILLLGNHDWSYYNEEIYRSEEYWCRHDHKNHDIIHKLFEDNKKLFELYYEIPNFCKGIKQEKLLFTHAGFTNDFFDNMSKTFDTTSISELCEELFKPENHSSLIFWVGYLRGGLNRTGSIIWADVREHGETKNKYLKPYYQIFGHTYCKKEIITDDFAMLDCGKNCFMLNENELCKLMD
jgi:flavodoxin